MLRISDCVECVFVCVCVCVCVCVQERNIPIAMDVGNRPPYSMVCRYKYVDTCVHAFLSF